MAKTGGGAQPQAGNSATMALRAKLNQGLTLHQQGKLLDAERVYAEILRRQPNHFDALHLLGVIALQTGRAERAVQLITQALGRNANIAAAHSNLGNALRALRRPDQALASYQRAIALQPDHPDAYNNRGATLQDLQRPDEALASYDRAIALKPDYADAYCNRGRTLEALQRPEAALASYDRAIALNPAHADAHCSRGDLLRALQRADEALESYDRAIALRPDHADAHNNRGNVLHALKRPEEALASYERAIALRADDADAYNNRGAVLHELKRPEEALASYERAIALRPDYADAYNNRGVVLQELRHPEEALASFERAIALAPDHANAHFNRGNALHDLKRDEEALASYDRAIALRPDHANAYSIRGNVLAGLERLEDALASYDQAIAISPDHAEALNDRGIVLSALGRDDAALASYHGALAARPGYANVYNNIGEVFERLGRFPEARAAFDAALRLAPALTVAYLNLSRHMTFTAGDPHLAAMQVLERVGDPSDTGRMYLHFALAKACADLGDHGGAFEHLLRANAQRRAQITYDEAASVGRFERIEAVFTRELVAAKAGLGDPSPVPIFVVGMPRSGTTLIEQIIASHPDVHGAGELRTLDRVVDATRGLHGQPAAYPEFVASADGALLSAIGAAYVAELRKIAPDARRITDKLPGNFSAAGLIHLVLPNACVIHAVRDPVDTCVSCFSTPFAAGHHYTYDLAELGRYYRRYQSLMAHWRRVLPSERILDVRYEDVVADLEGEARRILAHCRLRWDPRCLDFHRTDRPVHTASVTQVRQPIYRTAIGRGRAYEPYLGPLLAELGVRGGRT